MGVFLRFLNCTNGTKSRKASHKTFKIEVMKLHETETSHNEKKMEMVPISIQNLQNHGLSLFVKM